MIWNNGIKLEDLIVPTPFEGEELYTQMGFLFSQFWPIDIFIVES